MKKSYIFTIALIFVIFEAMPAAAQRGRVGGGAAASARAAGMGQIHTSLPPASVRTSTDINSRASVNGRTTGNSNTEVGAKANGQSNASAGAKVGGSAGGTKSVGPTAIAPGQGKGGGETRSLVKPGGKEMTITPSNVGAKAGASAHASVGTRVLTKLHLKKRQ